MYLAKMAEAGLDMDLEAVLAEWEVKAGSSDQIRASVDEHGMKGPLTIRLVGSLQRDGAIKESLFKEFCALQDKLDAANGAGAASESAPVAAEAVPASTPATPAATTPATAPVATEGAPMTADAIASHAFTEEQEAKIAERLRKEEERMRERLVAREAKIRLQMITGVATRATRLGLKAEDAAKLQALDIQIKGWQDAKKKINADIKTAREEMAVIRPKRKRTAATEQMKDLRVAKRKCTLATKAGDAEGMVLQQVEVDRLQPIVDAQKLAAAAAK